MRRLCRRCHAHAVRAVPTRRMPCYACPVPGSVDVQRSRSFRLVLGVVALFVAVTEWICVAWALGRFGLPLPTTAHVVGPLAICWLNRMAVLRRPPGGLRPRVPAGDGSATAARDGESGAFAAQLARLYLALVFICAFGGSFLV